MNTVVNNINKKGSLINFRNLLMIIPYKLEKIKVFLPIFTLILLPLFVFRSHFLGKGLWIGNPDRLNSHLKILKYHVTGIAEGGLQAWNPHEMMGYDTFTLPYTFPNIFTYMLQWCSDNLYFAAGIISSILLILSGIISYFFIKSYVPSRPLALIGAICYQLSALTILKVSQNDMSFAVFIVYPLIALMLKNLTPNNMARSFIIISLLIFSMLHFMFLQKVSYALLFLGSYALYLSCVKRKMLVLYIFSSAFIVACISAFPRIYGIIIAIKEYARNNLPGLNLSNFEDTYRFHNILPSQILRWFDETIFGHFPSEALPRGLNITEGFLLYTSIFVPLLIIATSIKNNNKWFNLGRTHHNHTAFFFWTLIFTISVIMFKPALFLIFILYQRVDFTHARILMVGLLPLATLTSIILYSICPKYFNMKNGLRTSLFGCAFAIIIVVGVGEYSKYYSGFLEWPFFQIPEILKGGSFFQTMHFAKDALARIIIYIMIFIVLFSGVKAHRPKFSNLCYCILCAIIPFQTIYFANFQINGQYTHDREKPFLCGNFYYAGINEFNPPNKLQIDQLKEALENKSFRSILICDPNTAGGFCAGHIPEFWNLRVVDGYYGIGVPKRLALLPWNNKFISLRTISFAQNQEIPWLLLSFLNVKYALVIDKKLYNNTLGSEGSTEFKKLKNPYAIVPRVFFVKTIHSISTANEAIQHLFQNNQLVNVTQHSYVEDFKGERSFESTDENSGTIQLLDFGDKFEVLLKPSNNERFLVLNELYFPGWQANINNKPARIYPVNAVMRGVFVPANTDKITFQYIPFVKTQKALFLYIIGLVLLITGSLFLYQKERKVRA